MGIKDAAAFRGGSDVLAALASASNRRALMSQFAGAGTAGGEILRQLHPRSARKLVRPSLWLRVWFLFRCSLMAAYRDNAFGIAKGAAYSGLLSFFPMLTTIAIILVQANAQSVVNIMSRFLSQVLPPGTEAMVVLRLAQTGERPLSLLLGALVISVWAASGLMTTLMDGFQAAYRVPRRRSFVRHRLVAIFLVFCTAVPALAASALIVFGHRTETALLQSLGVIGVGESLRGGIQIIGTIGRYSTAAITVILVTGVLYNFGPDRPRRMRGVWPGALLATLLWTLATSVFAWYMRNIADYSLLYGSIGAVIALLIWMYVLAVIALIGCEFNAERDRHAARRGPQRSA